MRIKTLCMLFLQMPGTETAKKYSLLQFLAEDCCGQIRTMLSRMCGHPGKELLPYIEHVSVQRTFRLFELAFRLTETV